MEIWLNLLQASGKNDKKNNYAEYLDLARICSATRENGLNLSHFLQASGKKDRPIKSC